MKEILELLPFNGDIKFVIGAIILFLLFFGMIFKPNIVKFLKKK